MKTFGDGYDWRGTKIEVGDTVIYGAGVGRSIAMVQAEVLEVKADKVKLKVLHRAYGGSYKDTVSVMCDRVTVVAELPPTPLKTATEEIQEREAEDKRRKANFASHYLLPEPVAPDQNDPKFQRPNPYAVTVAGSSYIGTNQWITVPTYGTTTTGIWAGGAGGGSYYPPGSATKPSRPTVFDGQAWRAAYEQHQKDQREWAQSPCQACPGISYYQLYETPCAASQTVVDSSHDDD